MYQKNSEFEEPSADTIIWRYVDFTKFISYLEKNALFFVRSDQFSDKYEGKFTEADVKLWEDKLKPKTKLSQIELYDRFRKVVNISSWHINENESAAMWEICLQSNEGVAIKSTFKRLKDSFVSHKEDEVHIGKVKYIDYKRDTIPIGNLFNPFLFKRKAFEYERELRAVIMKFAPQEEAIRKLILYVDPKWFGIHVKTDLDVLIDKIVVSPSVPDWFIDLVKSIVRKYELNKRVEKSCRLLSREYLAQNDKRAYNETLRNIILSRSDAVPKYNPFDELCLLQKRWNDLIEYSGKSKNLSYFQEIIMN